MASLPQCLILAGVDVRGQVASHDGPDGHALPSQLDGGLEEGGPRQLPVAAVGLLVAPDLTWDGDPLRP